MKNEELSGEAAIFLSYEAPKNLDLKNTTDVKHSVCGIPKIRATYNIA